jgi:5,10-methylene-tetrahydrofolate dehydrogenase/methenyl tetrahydrofolate cyclohydrolase
MQLLDGKACAATIKREVAAAVAARITATRAGWCGEDPASKVYVGVMGQQRNADRIAHVHCP